MSQSNEIIVKQKTGLLNLAVELTHVSRACKIAGLSRETFYRCATQPDLLIMKYVFTFLLYVCRYNEKR